MVMPPRATQSSSGKKCFGIGNEDEGNLPWKGDKEDVRSTYFFKFLFQYLTLSWSATGLNSLNQWRRQRKIQKGTEFPRLSLGRLYFYSKNGIVIQSTVTSMPMSGDDEWPLNSERAWIENTVLLEKDCCTVYIRFTFNAPWSNS